MMGETERIKVSSLDIIVTMIDQVPYYEIKYKELGKNHYNIGYSSYELANVLAECEQVSEVHLALVYRGTPENAAKFIAAQDALIEELYAEPEPKNSGETAEGTESKESEGAEPSAESEATE